MTSISTARVILGGFIAGAIINVCEYVLHGVVLKTEWEDVLRSLSRPPEPSAAQIAGYNVVGFVLGMSAAWLYAAIRPRFGPGPSAATNAGLFIWLIGWAAALAVPTMAGIYPIRLAGLTAAVGLVEAVGATMVAAALYREGVATASSKAASAR
jgi:hypothetical protein